MARALAEQDPLTLAAAPPKDETPAQRIVREKSEAEARRINDAIDEQIKKEKAASKRRKRPVKVLLLGQSESGKSATLKNFQLTYARRKWTEERLSWRSVIQLNLVRNVNTILDALAREASEPSILSHTDADDEANSPIAQSPIDFPVQLADRYNRLNSRLFSLRKVQKDLETRLGAASSEETNYNGVYDPSLGLAALERKPKNAPEFTVNSSNGWKSALSRVLPGNTPDDPSGPNLSGSDSQGEKITEAIAACRTDIIALWSDPIVQEVFSRRSKRIQDAPGFFLDDAKRIANADYQPTDNDVVRARLRTLGVQEHKFVFEQGRTAGREWLMYDVGGTRSSRAAWASYFDDMDAIIFLAPISCFDEVLNEDKNVNRLEDSYLLWRTVCSSKLLARTQIILFLNKCDLLLGKLKRGILVKDHIRSYGNASNDAVSVTKYFQQHFKDISRQYSPQPRPFFVHLTSVIDTKATAATLAVVEEGIVRDNLSRADLL
ncbi:G-alpha-domain-containing protein [Athelia psychrophila]|uniref:G-alpha-domain-containing protein n=1 Tax=Athelia psychrophila TaxID=1759441 RepID=A0A166W0K2_9AGAM|nr:G-alpha-domain-containing protein [Fibularhizoctonia sp. CBS 109695]